MVTPSVGSVVLVRFPFSDPSASKLRPAVVLAGVDRDDWILCQVTSNPYSDAKAVEIRDSDFCVRLPTANKPRSSWQAVFGEHGDYGTCRRRAKATEVDKHCRLGD